MWKFLSHYSRALIRITNDFPLESHGTHVYKAVRFANPNLVMDLPSNLDPRFDDERIPEFLHWIVQKYYALR